MMRKTNRREFLTRLALFLPFTLLPDTCGRTMALVCPPENPEENNTKVTDKEDVEKDIPKAMQFQRTGMTEDFKLKFFELKTEVVRLFSGVFIFRGLATPYSPFYKPKYFALEIDLAKWQRSRYYKMKILTKVEEAVLYNYKNGEEIKFYRRTA